MGAGEGKKRAKFWEVRRRGVGRREGPAEEMKNKIQKIKHKKEILCRNPKKRKKKGKNKKSKNQQGENEKYFEKTKQKTWKMKNSKK